MHLSYKVKTKFMYSLLCLSLMSNNILSMENNPLSKQELEEIACALEVPDLVPPSPSPRKKPFSQANIINSDSRPPESTSLAQKTTSPAKKRYKTIEEDKENYNPQAEPQPSNYSFIKQSLKSNMSSRRKLSYGNAFPREKKERKSKKLLLHGPATETKITEAKTPLMPDAASEALDQSNHFLILPEELILQNESATETTITEEKTSLILDAASETLDQPNLFGTLPPELIADIGQRIFRETGGKDILNLKRTSPYFNETLTEDLLRHRQTGIICRLPNELLRLIGSYIKNDYQALYALKNTCTDFRRRLSIGDLCKSLNNGPRILQAITEALNYGMDPDVMQAIVNSACTASMAPQLLSEVTASLRPPSFITHSYERSTALRIAAILKCMKVPEFDLGINNNPYEQVLTNTRGGRRALTTIQCAPFSLNEQLSISPHNVEQHLKRIIRQGSLSEFVALCHEDHKALRTLNPEDSCEQILKVMDRALAASTQEEQNALHAFMSIENIALMKTEEVTALFQDKFSPETVEQVLPIAQAAQLLAENIETKLPDYNMHKNTDDDLFSLMEKVHQSSEWDLEEFSNYSQIETLNNQFNQFKKMFAQNMPKKSDDIMTETTIIDSESSQD